MKRIEFETFLPLSSWHRSQLEDKVPSAVNKVRVRKYRVVWEEIEEPVEVIRERIQKLWNECTSHHRWAGLRAAAKEVGLELSHETRGKKP